MSEVALPGAFVDETSFKDFNNSFDTDDPLLNGDFEDEYISSIEEITNFMNNTTTGDNNIDPSTAPIKKITPPSSFRLLTKATGDDKFAHDDKEKSNPQQRKSKYYAPLYVVRDRVAGTGPQNPPSDGKRSKPSTSDKEKRTRKEDGSIRTKERPPRQTSRKDDESTVEIKKKEREEDVRDSLEQQRKLEEMRRAHEQEQLDRERRLREKEKERVDREKLQASRIPGERATLYDLMTVQFSPTATFEPGEVVLVPRTRGGYSYGRVVQHFLMNHCYADPSVQHSTYHWRIVYPNPGGGNMFKDLPPAYIGKLVSSFNKNLVMPKDEDGERTIGDKPLGKDLNNAVFLPTNQFNPHQIVLVPRSKGGFTYGRVVKECTFTCRVDDSNKHEVPGWRVLVSGVGGTGGEESGGPKVRKDVLAGNIGKLYIPEQLQAAMQAASEAASLAGTPGSGSGPSPGPVAVSISSARRRISPESRDPFPAPPPSVLPTALSLPQPGILNYAQALQGANGPTTTATLNASAPSTSPVPPAAMGSTTPRTPIVPENSSEALGELSNEGLNNEKTSPTEKVPTAAAGGGGMKTEAHGEMAGDGSAPNKPLRGVLELPEGMFVKAQKDSQKMRNSRYRENTGNMNNNYDNNNNNSNAEKPLIVIDGPNVAMKHGKTKNNFSVKGVSLALHYYKAKGFDALAFVPEYFATRKAPQQLGSSTLKLGDFMQVGDDLPMLQRMVEQGLIVLTPPQDYDDSYSIDYARRHNACIVTNDRYNDNIDKQPTEREKAQTRKFIREHCISFTFVRDEFMPNPDFKFPN